MGLGAEMGGCGVFGRENATCERVDAAVGDAVGLIGPSGRTGLAHTRHFLIAQGERGCREALIGLPIALPKEGSVCPMERRVVILGAAGRDFHNFNVCFRGETSDRVIAFTAAQIPDIAGRRYPPELAGPGYPEGIPVIPESELEKWVVEKKIDLVVFSYSDVSHNHVMDLASRAVARGANFEL